LGNKYLADEEPWKLIKTDQKDRVKTIMNISLQLCGVLSIVSEPFLPSTSSKLKNILNINENSWDSISINNPVVINNINKSELIFRKIEDHEIDFQLQKLNESK
jgi:methionyl-tRNA synthetase